jgi:putative PEP-CTERM system histidine kinase
LSDSWYSNPGVWSYAAASLAFAWLVVRLVADWQPGGKPAMLLLLAATTAVAAAAASAFAGAPTLVMWHAVTLTELLRYAATLGFLIAFLGVRDPARAAQRGGRHWALTVAFGAVLLMAQLLLRFKPPGVPDLGQPLHQLGFVSALALAIFGLTLVEQCYRRTPAGHRWHVRPLLLALGGLLVYDVVLFSDALLFRSLDVQLWSARGFAQALTVPLMLLTLKRTRDWSFELSVSRGVLAGSTALLAVGGYLILMAGAGFLLRELGGSWGRALESALVFAALLLLAVVGMSATFRAKLRVLIAKNFFTYRYDYREVWLRFTNTLAAGAARPTAACVRALADLVESPGGGLWLRDESRYRRVERTGLMPGLDELAAADALPAFLQRTGWVLDISDVMTQSAKYPGLKLPPELAAMRDAWLVVPLRAADDLVGFVVLAAPRVRIDLDWEVLDLLKTAGRQAASYLAYAQATEALLEARKFDAFHRMSTFVVHDLKNLIAQLQLVLSNVERHGDNPDFQRDMLKTIEHVVGRMHQLTLQLRPEASGADRVQAVDVSAVVRRVQALRAAGRHELRVEADEGVLAWAHEDLLERVVAHLVQNAFDASGAVPEVGVRVARDGDGVMIEVSDRGCGMTPEFVRDRLFRPFDTTKATGTGIGAFECQQYAQQVGGRLEVDSAPGQGTRVRLRLREVVPARNESELVA